MANRKQRRAAARKGESEEELELAEAGAEGVAEPGSVPFPDHEQDVLFKVQMRVQNVVLGYWKYGLVVTVVGLLIVLVTGLYAGQVEDAQKDVQAKIADIDRKMPKVNPLAQAGISDPDDKPEVLSEVEEGAARYEAIAAEATGVSATIAWMRAAMAWERAGKSERVLAAYEGAHRQGSTGTLGWSAASSYAAALGDSGDVDGASTLLRTLADTGDGLMAEQALLSLGRLFEDADRITESRKVYGEFAERYPQSALSSEVSIGLSRLGAGG